MQAVSGLILFAHGARDPRWAASFEAVVERIKATHPHALVRLAFLELMTPDLPTAVDELATAGCTTIQVLPLFLGTGGHLRRDLPALLDAQRTRWPGIDLVLQPAVGEHAQVIDAMAAAATGLLAT